MRDAAGRCEDDTVVRFRYNAAGAVAAVIALIGAVPLAASRPYLLPVLQVPVTAALWVWRTATDADRAGLYLRALFGSRALPWSRVVELSVGYRGRVYATTTARTVVRLPAVTPADLPRLVEASGRPLDSTAALARPADRAAAGPARPADSDPAAPARPADDPSGTAAAQ